MGSLTLKKLNLCSLMLLLAITSTVLISQLPGGNTINFAITAVFIAVAFAIAMIEKRPFRLFSPFVVLALWLCFALIPSMLAIDINLALERVIQMIQIVVLVFLATNVIVWSGRSEVFNLVYILAAVFSYVASLTGIGFGVIDETLIAEENVAARVMGLTGNANAFGILMVQAQMATIFFAVQVRERYVKYLTLSAFLILGTAVIHSGSRTALVGMIVLVVGCSWIFRIWRIKNAAKALRVLALVCLFAGVAFVSLKDINLVQSKVESFVSNEVIVGRYENLLTMFAAAGALDETDTSIDRSIVIRAQYARDAWEAAVSTAPFGLGLNNFTVSHGTYAHSNYFEILATTGFIGLFIFVCIYISMYVRAYRIRRERHDNPLPVRVFIVSVAVLMLMDVANVSYYAKPFWIFVAIAIGSIEISRDAQSFEKKT